MENVLHLLLQSSDYYAPFAGTMLTSLFENNKELDQIHVYLMTADMSEENKARFQFLGEQYHRTVHFIDATEIDRFLVEHSVQEYHGSYATYYKIFALSVMNVDIDKLIYMDSDILINGSLLGLINFDLQGKILGMCIDPSSETHKKCIKLTSQLYHNCGVMVFDAKRWIAEGCPDQVIEHIKNIHSMYPVVDQDIFNLVFQGKIQTLPLIYGLLTDTLILGDYHLIRKVYGVDHYHSKEECDYAKKNAVVLHYGGDACSIALRPWVEGSEHPLRDLWIKYLALSPWADCKLPEAKIAFPFRVQRILFKLLPHRLYAFINRNVTGFLQRRRARKMGL